MMSCFASHQMGRAQHGTSRTGDDAINVQITNTSTDEIVVKNPLSPAEHKGGVGVKNELFELGLDQFIRGLM